MYEMRTILVSLSFLVLNFSCLNVPSDQEDGPAHRPNFVLLMGDDHGWDEVGYNGHPFVKTPVLDDMARKGMRFDRFYSGHPTCSPTRASFLTGRHPNRMGTFAPNWSMRPEEVSIAHMLKQAGYRTAHFGKWHVGPVKKGSPTSPGAMGFDEWLSHDNFFELDPVLSRNGEDPRKFEGESSKVLIDEAIRFMDRSQEDQQPFLLVVWFGSPHEPYSGLPEDLALYHNLPDSLNQDTVSLTSNETGQSTRRPLRDVLQERYAEITAMDRAIGQLRDYLREKDLRENTLLMYCGDNGTPASADRTGMTIREDKGSLYEGGILVPGLVEWPAVINQPAVNRNVAVTSDILPTLAEIIDLEIPHRPIDGISLLPYLKNPQKERNEPAFFWQFNPNSVFGDSPEPYIDPELQEGTTPLIKMMNGKYTRTFRNYVYADVSEDHFIGERAVITNNYKLILEGDNHDGVGYELYDLKNDRAEAHNIAASHPNVLEKMQQQMKAWQESVLNSLTGADYSVADIDSNELIRDVAERAFSAARNLTWQEVLTDDGTGDWTREWFLDGDKASVFNSQEGMTLHAGPVPDEDASHAVLWTKRSFEGDIKIEYDFTRLDTSFRGVNILYLLATGSGEAPYEEDIAEWSELRRVPTMSKYFRNMNTYHISYATAKPEEDYVRARRYLPVGNTLRGTNMEPDYYNTDLFHPGVTSHITVIKTGDWLFMEVDHPEQRRLFAWRTDTHPTIDQGRIGFRQMFTRRSRYRNIRISRVD